MNPCHSSSCPRTLVNQYSDHIHPIRHGDSLTLSKRGRTIRWAVFPLTFSFLEWQSSVQSPQRERRVGWGGRHAEPFHQFFTQRASLSFSISLSSAKASRPVSFWFKYHIVQPPGLGPGVAAWQDDPFVGCNSLSLYIYIYN